MPAHAGSKPFGNGKMGTMPGKTKHGPFNAGNRGGNTGKFSRQDEQQSDADRQQAHVQQRAASLRRRDGRRTFQPALRLGPIARMSFARGGFGGGRSFGGGVRAALTADASQSKQNRAEHTLCPVSFETG